MVLTRVFGIIFMHTHTQREFYCIIKHDKIATEQSQYVTPKWEVRMQIQ